MNADTPATAANYRSLALAWGRTKEQPDEANRLFREHHRVYKELRQTTDGQTAMSSLLDDPEAVVRLLAATHCLAWDQDRAESVLTQLAVENGPLAFDARWTLKAFRNGNLDLDW